MKKLLYTIFIFIISFSTFSACDESEELTPKVDDTTSDYSLPTGVILTAQEREEVQERWNEYNTAINQ